MAKNTRAADHRMRVPGIEGKERGPGCPGRLRLCLDLQVHMQREARQWTQTTRAILVFLVFLIIAYPVLAVTCPHCPPALRHCRVARNRSRGRHVVFVAQCNGRVLHVIYISRRRISSHRSPSPCPVQSSPVQSRPWGAKERDGQREESGQGGEREKKEQKEKGGRQPSCACASPDWRPGQAHRAYWACPVSTNQAMMGGVEVFRRRTSLALVHSFQILFQLSSGEPHRTHAVAHVDASNFFPSSDCPEVMQCNAMQGSVMQACADRPRHRSVRSVSQSLSVLLLLDVTSGTGKRMQDPVPALSVPPALSSNL